MVTMGERINAARLLLRMREHGGVLTISGDTLDLDYPIGFPEQLKQELKANKAALRGALTCPSCGVRPVVPPHYGRCEICTSAAWLVIKGGRLLS